MGDKSNIEWTDATWNPIVGCSIVSPGCTNCYAMTMAARIERMSEARRPGGTLGPMTHYDGTTKKVNGNAVWTGKITLAPDHILTAPLRWKKPRRIFVNSMGDLFHESVPDEWIDKIFAVMALCPQHTFQVLTKRAERMRDYCRDFTPDRLANARAWVIMNSRAEMSLVMRWPLPNVWLGVSCERQQEADERRERLALLAADGWTTFCSYEPALGQIDWRGWEFLKWLISGGESGPKARPSQSSWHRAARDFCAANGIKYFFKQWGEFLPVGQHLPSCGKIHGATAVRPGRVRLHYSGSSKQEPKYAFAERGIGFIPTSDNRLAFRVGKKAAGRLLDGREWNEFPQVRA